MYTAAQTRTRQDRLGRALISHQTPLSLGCDDITSNSQRPIRAVTSNCLSQNGYKAILQPRGKRICLRQGSAVVKKKERFRRGGGVCGWQQVLYRCGSRKVPKVINMVPKRKPKRATEPSKTPLRNSIGKVSKRMPKGSVRASTVGTFFD